MALLVPEYLMPLSISPLSTADGISSLFRKLEPWRQLEGDEAKEAM
jgi:hypothetical protein